MLHNPVAPALIIVFVVWLKWIGRKLLSLDWLGLPWLDSTSVTLFSPSQISWLHNMGRNVWQHTFLHVITKIWRVFVMCPQWRHKSTYAAVQSEQSFHCTHDDTLIPWLYKICQVDSDQTDLNFPWEHISEGTFFSDAAVLYINMRFAKQKCIRGICGLGQSYQGLRCSRKFFIENIY